MKKLFILFAGVLAGFIVITSSGCDENGDLLPLPSMKATVDGEAWSSIFRLSVVKESDSLNTIVITGTPTASETADKTIILTTFGTNEGTYTLSLGSLSTDCSVVYKKTADAADGGDNYYVAYEATITISEHDRTNKKLSGTFSAKLRSTGNIADEVIITDGVFKNINYQ